MREGRRARETERDPARQRDSTGPMTRFESAIIKQNYSFFLCLLPNSLVVFFLPFLAFHSAVRFPSEPHIHALLF